MLPLLVPALVATAGLPGGAGPGQEAQPEYAIKARFLLQFPEFVTWPAEAGLEDASKPFVLVVLGVSPFEQHLDALAGRKVKGHPLKVVYATDLSALDGCHMVFVCGSEKARIKDILARAGSKPVLTVGDTDGFSRHGVMINLTIEESLPRFEISLSAARGAGLGINAQLLSLARKVW